MNSIFAAKKLNVPIDVVRICGPPNVFLSQAAHSTGGVYEDLLDSHNLLPHLMGTFFGRLSTRRNLIGRQRDDCYPSAAAAGIAPVGSTVAWASSNNRLDEFACSPVTPVTLKYLMELGKTRNALESAQLLHKKLPKRLARRVRALQKLPFIVGVNPWIKKVYQLYLDSFETLSVIPPPVDDASRMSFDNTLSELVHSHQDVIPNLAKGFLECGKHMSKEDSTAFLDGMIHARIAIRVLAEHHLAIRETTPNWIGIVNTKLYPAQLIRATCEYVQELCEINYGSAPDFVLDGHLDTSIAYINVHLDYIFMELFKNANRATVEHSIRTGRKEHPPIEITIARGDDDVTIRIRDQGGGISPEDLPRVFDYSFTTVPKSDMDDETSIFTTQMKINMQTGVGGPLAGLGFGLPMSRIYAKYFGGSLDLRNVRGHGLDVFLRVPIIAIEAPALASYTI